MPSDFPPGRVRQALRPESIGEGNEAPQQQYPIIPNCSVPVTTGTMLVFSNYQMAHRVLRMVNTSQEHPSSRKFVALFVMDPAAERLVPARCHLAHSYLYKRALTGNPCAPSSHEGANHHLPEMAALLVMEYAGIVPSLHQRRLTRNEMLRAQLVPKHFLGSSLSMVYGTGNGCLTMIGWIDSLLKEGERERENAYLYSHHFNKPEARINALNFPAKEVGRGLSETLSIPSDDLNFPPFFDSLQDADKKLKSDMSEKEIE